MRMRISAYAGIDPDFITVYAGKNLRDAFDALSLEPFLGWIDQILRSCLQKELENLITRV